MWTRLLYIKHNFLGEILDFFGKESYGNLKTISLERIDEDIRLIFRAKISGEKAVLSSQLKKKELFPTN